MGGLGPVQIDLMASATSAQRIPRSSSTLPFLSQHHCAESSEVDMLQDKSRLPGTVRQAFGHCFPPPAMVRHVMRTRILWSPLRDRTGIQSCNRQWCGRWKWPRRECLGSFSGLTRTVRFGNGGTLNGRWLRKEETSDQRGN